VAECLVLGVVLGLVSSIIFGANTIITRRGVLRVSSGYIANVSIFTGCLFFVMVTTATGELSALSGLSWKAYLFWALAGIVHFALGRTWSYRSVQFIGSNRSIIVTSLNPIATVILAVAVLQERMSLAQVAGALMTISGPLLILMKERTSLSVARTTSGSYGKQIDRRALTLGLVYGVGAAVFWGSSAIFIKLALDAGGKPIVGSLISYAAAAVVISPFVFLNRKNRTEFFSGDSLQLAIWSGLTTGIAQLLRYLALAAGSVIVVSLMLRAQPLWVLAFAFIFIREHESFSRWVLLGNGLVLAGTVLIAFS
jgi:drug/metabolite transporter (DMT)-like permease